MATPVATSYCPGVYTVTDGIPSTSCSAVANLVAWLLTQYTDFQNDSEYPWNTYTTALFVDGSATTPYSVSGPGATIGYGDPALGSNYTVGYPFVALDGPTAGNICAYAQIIAMRINGNTLIITPLDVPGKSESCQCSNPWGLFPWNTFYIPLPSIGECVDPGIGGGGIQIAYLPYVLHDNVDCLPTYSGGTYNFCNTPDPFFGSDDP